MKIRTALAGVAVMLSSSAFAAAPDYLVVDKSSTVLIDAATSTALFAEVNSLRLAKLYPPSIWGFASQVEGGITPAGMCVVTARFMLLPRNNPRMTKVLLFKPEKMATAFDAFPQATPEKCRELAKVKLREAMQGLTSALAPK